MGTSSKSALGPAGNCGSSKASKKWFNLFLAVLKVFWGVIKVVLKIVWAIVKTVFKILSCFRVRWNPLDKS